MFLIQRALRAPQNLREFSGGDGLEHVVCDFDLDGFSGILEFIVPAHDDELRHRQKRAHSLDHFQAVHEVHAHIGNDEVRPRLLGQLQRVQPVVGLCDQAEAAGLPVNDFLHALADFRLVVHQHRSVKHPVMRRRALAPFQ